MSKFFAGMFLLMIACLTAAYFSINLPVMSQGYKMILGVFSVLNILLLAATILNAPKNFHWFLMLFMLIGGFAKALFERNLPGRHLDDFIFTVWRFNDNWSYMLKVLWHTSLDWLVLFIALGIKNSYKLFERKI